APTERAAKAKSFVRPGRCVWQWLSAGDPKYGEQKIWYDRTKSLGFEYYLIDAGWKGWRDGDMDQWACLAKWIAYGKSIGIGTFMWVDSKEIRTAKARVDYLSKVRASGAVGIKIDFVPTPTYAQMKWYEETSADTFSFGLMLDYHGAVKPSGREKTWPHEVAREAIRGHEWHITRYNRVLPPEHDCILPFTRLVQGHADYTPVVFEKKELCGYTWARELAQGIVFSAPFLCFGDYPKNYLDNPSAELIRAMPSVYDEVRVLPGSEIGECIAVAKRSGSEWFLAVENGSAARNLDISLAFLGEGRYRLLGFADAEGCPDGYLVERRMVGAGDRLDLEIRPSGGYVAMFKRDAGKLPCQGFPAAHS
ncbi:MAG: glycoside hydrolase family 97 catalytic domain-containing protein, partial [bacterium]|nr:glycoside hydrolase family 97 catalytic domain-containing protein [Candidatus Colisoma equi]